MITSSRNFFISAFVLVLACAGCAGKPAPMTAPGVPSSGNPLVDGVNAQLALVTVEEYKLGAPVSAQERADMIDRAVAVIKAMLPRLPEGYVIQVTGHTDTQGGAQSKANLAVSARKAQLVFGELGKKGVAGARLVTKGAGGTMLVAACGEKEPCQRRVTFIVVKK